MGGSSVSKIGLGTVRFAAPAHRHDYGVPVDEAREILEAADRLGVRLMDTAAQAGNSEQVLGECLPVSHKFLIIAKTPHFSGDFITPQQADHLEAALRRSLENMRQERIYGLMIGFDDGLFSRRGELLAQRMEELKSQGLIEKVGVSVSEASEIDRLLASYRPDMIQLPLSVLDQRLLFSGHLGLIKRRGIELHARDIFLQGVLLDPTRLHPWFWPIRKLLNSYHDYLVSEGLTPTEAALSFAANIQEVDYALVGVTSAHQLEEIAGNLDTALRPSDLAQFACQDEKFANPLCWNLYE